MFEGLVGHAHIGKGSGFFLRMGDAYIVITERRSNGKSNIRLGRAAPNERNLENQRRG